jgi:hypothetical protein
LSKPKLFLFLMAPPKKYYNLFHSISSEWKDVQRFLF